MVGADRGMARTAMALICAEIPPALDDRLYPHPRVLSLGVFDGMHRGHQQLIRRTVEAAHQPDGGSGRGTAIVFTFKNHPLSLLAPPYTPKRLSSPAQKAFLLEKMGADVLIMPEFDPSIASLSAARFLDEVLLEKLGVDRIIAGFDFRFGQRGEGDCRYLAEQGRVRGISVEVLPALYHGGSIISSTRIRELLEEGRVGEVLEMLGRPYSLEGPVVRGFGRGRGLGYPTANVEFDRSFVLPGSGVYAIFAQCEGSLYGGMMNIGTSPTFGDADYRAEANLFDFAGESLYGQAMRISFVERIREERRFASAEDLKRRIRLDEKLARAVVGSFQGRESLLDSECLCGDAEDRNEDGR